MDEGDDLFSDEFSDFQAARCAENMEFYSGCFTLHPMFLLHISSRVDPQHKSDLVQAALILLPQQTTEELPEEELMGS